MDGARLIREARAAAALPQSRLAELSGTSQATLSGYERGVKVPSSTTLARILAACGMRLAATPRSRPVRTPGAAALARSDRVLGEVLELAAELPAHHRPALGFPRLPTGAQPSS